MSRIELYDAKNIEEAVWSDTEEGQYAKAFLLPFIKNGPHHYINNVKTQMMMVTIDDHYLPITLSDASHEEGNSYVCSPYTHYISYALAELHHIKNPLLRGVLKGSIKSLGAIFKRCRFDKNVIINNWLVSTNLYPQLKAHQIQTITEFLKNRFPDHALLFRSLNAHLNEDLCQTMQAHNYQLILSRQVYVLDTFNEAVFRSKPFKQDLKLLENAGYKVDGSAGIHKGDIPRIVDLYNKLYLNKYSLLNPQFNEHFIALCLQSNILTIKALRNKDNELDGILGYFHRNGVMTTPLFGYETSLPQKQGLYRLISTVLALDAKHNKKILNQSSGAAGFKSVRKAMPHLEYTAVYHHHLSSLRKLPWNLLKLLANKVILPLMKFYKL